MDISIIAMTLKIFHFRYSTVYKQKTIEQVIKLRLSPCALVSRSLIRLKFLCSSAGKVSKPEKLH